MAAPDGAYPPFVVRAPWWGGDLQTMRNFLRGGRHTPAAARDERLELPADDVTGDRLVATLSWPTQRRVGAPAALLIHGLSGSESSVYMLATARALLAAGLPVVRLNLRGAGASRRLCREGYHAGRTDDLSAALAALPAAVAASGFLAVGYSLGGNLLLKYLGEQGAAAPFVAAVTVSAPLDLAAIARRIGAWRNTIYHRWLLRRLVRENLAPAAVLSAAERSAALGARTLYELDDRYIAPRYGFAGADDYYARCSAARFLPDIAIPTLLIHARNDPWVPTDVYDRVPWRDLPSLRPLLAAGGGHVGFHGRDWPLAWHDRCILKLLDRLS